VLDGEVDADCHGDGVSVEGGRLVAVLVDGVDDASVGKHVGGLDDFDVGGFAGLIDDHLDGDCAGITCGDIEYVVAVDVDGVDEDGRCDTGGDANRSWGCGRRGVNLGEHNGLDVAGLKYGRRTGLSRRRRLCMEHDRREREDGQHSTLHLICLSG